MWEQENIRSTAGRHSPSVSMKTFIYTSRTQIFDSHKGHRVHNPNSTLQSLYWSLYCTPMVFIYSLSLSVLDVFTKQGKSVCICSQSDWGTTNDRAFRFQVAALMCSTVTCIYLGKCKKLTSNTQNQLLLLIEAS